MLSNSWVKLKRPVMKVNPRRSSWVGHHRSGHHVIRLSLASTKVSGPLTSVRSTDCWLLEAWINLYACGIHITLGKGPRVTGILFFEVSCFQNTIIFSPDSISILENQLVFWKATLLLSSPSASPQKTIKSSLSQQTALWKWLMTHFYALRVILCFPNYTNDLWFLLLYSHQAHVHFSNSVRKLDIRLTLPV